MRNKHLLGRAICVRNWEANSLTLTAYETVVAFLNDISPQIVGLHTNRSVPDEHEISVLSSLSAPALLSLTLASCGLKSSFGAQKFTNLRFISFHPSLEDLEVLASFSGRLETIICRDFRFPIDNWFKLAPTLQMIAHANESTLKRFDLGAGIVQLLEQLIQHETEQHPDDKFTDAIAKCEQLLPPVRLLVGPNDFPNAALLVVDKTSFSTEQRSAMFQYFFRTWPAEELVGLISEIAELADNGKIFSRNKTLSRILMPIADRAIHELPEDRLYSRKCKILYSSLYSWTLMHREPFAHSEEGKTITYWRQLLRKALLAEPSLEGWTGRLPSAVMAAIFTTPVEPKLLNLVIPSFLEGTLAFQYASSHQARMLLTFPEADFPAALLNPAYTQSVLQLPLLCSVDDLFADPLSAEELRKVLELLRIALERNFQYNGTRDDFRLEILVSSTPSQEVCEELLSMVLKIYPNWWKTLSSPIDAALIAALRLKARDRGLDLVQKLRDWSAESGGATASSIAECIWHDAFNQCRGKPAKLNAVISATLKITPPPSPIGFPVASTLETQKNEAFWPQFAAELLLQFPEAVISQPRTRNSNGVSSVGSIFEDDSDDLFGN